MSNKIIGVVLTIVVGVILLGSVVMTAIDNATDDQRTIFNNEVNDKYSLLYDEELDSLNATITLNAYSDRYITVEMGGISTIVPTTVRNSMLMTDKGFVRVDPANSGIGLYLAGESAAITESSITLPVTASIVNGVVTITDSGTLSKTFTPEEWVFIPNPEGDFEIVPISTTTPIYVNSLKDVYWATMFGTNLYGFGWGNGDQCTFFNSGESYSVGEGSLTAVDEFIDLYTLNLADYRISADAGLGNNGEPLYPGLLMIPISVDAHTEQNRSIVSLLSVIPLLFIVALITIAVSIIRNNQ